MFECFASCDNHHWKENVAYVKRTTVSRFHFLSRPSWWGVPIGHKVQHQYDTSRNSGSIIEDLLWVNSCRANRSQCHWKNIRENLQRNQNKIKTQSQYFRRPKSQKNFGGSSEDNLNFKGLHRNPSTGLEPEYYLSFNSFSKN